MIEALLRQYIDESTEYITKEPDAKPDVKPDVKPDNPVEKPAEKLVEKPIEIPQPIKEPVCPVPEPVFIPIEEPKPKLSFNPEVETFDLPPLESPDDFKIGEDIPIQALCFDDMDKGETLDLGIVEL